MQPSFGIEPSTFGQKLANAAIFLQGNHNEPTRGRVTVLPNEYTWESLDVETRNHNDRIV